MLNTLLATLWLGLYPTPLHQWEVDTLEGSLLDPQRVEVTKERDSVLCSTVDDRFVFPPSYSFKERVNLLERACEQYDETISFAAIRNGQANVPESTSESKEQARATKTDGQNEQVVKPTVEQPKAEAKSSTPKTEPVKAVVQEEPKPQPKQQTQVTQKKEEPKQVQSSTVVGNFNTSHYTARCTGCSGITASGYDVRNTIYSPEGYRVVAADPRVLPLGTVVRVTYSNGTSFLAKVLDTGGAIKGHKLDVLVSTKDEAYRLGRVTTKVEIVR